MGDSGEGLIDAEARIQERIEEMQMERQKPANASQRNPEQARQVESLKLARKEMAGQLETTRHPARKAQITLAIEDLDRRIAELGAVYDRHLHNP